MASAMEVLINLPGPTQFVPVLDPKTYASKVATMSTELEEELEKNKPRGFQVNVERRNIGRSTDKGAVLIPAAIAVGIAAGTIGIVHPDQARRMLETIFEELRKCFSHTGATFSIKSKGEEVSGSAGSVEELKQMIPTLAPLVQHIMVEQDRPTLSLPQKPVLEITIKAPE